FPTANAIQPTNRGSTDVFVTKINPGGSALVYSSYLGGSHEDNGSGIALDLAGNTYVTGTTNSADFPTKNAIQATFGNGDGGAYVYDAFVAEINAAGSALVYSTYLGGTGDDHGAGIAVDSVGQAYATGWTTSTDFPTKNAIQLTNHGIVDVFLTKFSANGSALVYSTYLGGSDYDYGTGVALDSAGNAYLTGLTRSLDFPLANAFQSEIGGITNAFVTKINPQGSALAYSTYLGGSLQDYGQGIAVDTAGKAYVVGITSSTNFPTVNAVQPALGGGNDAFVTKINPQGSALVYSTYLGGSRDDQGLGIT